MDFSRDRVILKKPICVFDFGKALETRRALVPEICEVIRPSTAIFDLIPVSGVMDFDIDPFWFDAGSLFVVFKQDIGPFLLEGTVVYPGVIDFGAIFPHLPLNLEFRD